MKTGAPWLFTRIKVRAIREPKRWQSEYNIMFTSIKMHICCEKLN